MYCTYCGFEKHNENTCPELAEWQGPFDINCTNCWEDGHTAKNCPHVYTNVRAQDLQEMREDDEFDGIDLED